MDFSIEELRAIETAVWRDNVLARRCVDITNASKTPDGKGAYWAAQAELTKRVLDRVRAEIECRSRAGGE